MTKLPASSLRAPDLSGYTIAFDLDGTLVDTLAKLPLIATWLVLTLPRLVETLPKLVFVFDNVVETTDKFESVAESDVETLVRLVDTLPRLELNATFSAQWPNITRKKDTPPDADEWKGKPGKRDLLER